MTKQQKFLLLIVLIVAGASATIYVNTNKNKMNIDSDSKNVASNILDNVSNQTSNNVNQTVNQNTNQVQPSAPSPKPVTNNTAPTPTPKPTPTPAPTPKTPVQYVNNVSYYTPSGMPEVIHVNISILDGVISDITFSYDTPTNRESGQYLSRFSSSLNKSAIIGKRITNVSLSRVGGASLTTDAFMQAIQDTAAKV